MYSFIYDSEVDLTHHGILGMKWGVRRYQNPDGTLTAAGKKRKARDEINDEKYRQRQIRVTSNYYDKNRYGGLYGLTNITKGINSLTKSAERDEVRYQKTGDQRYRNRAAETAKKVASKEAMKQYELEKVKSLTHDQIKKEKAAVGKAFIQSVGINVGMNALLLPTTGMAYLQIPSGQNVRSNERFKS